ncbi:unnamed protein product [Ambrosiozyma monospora]|uniref:Unnamed protein product n=1 Tax=Ambrosiozyma monospora TaxID=43982 RepID=A0A9W6YQ05_AMBMO|nr:unnamed protein product [Ambrosiozyma monospora]
MGVLTVNKFEIADDRILEKKVCMNDLLTNIGLYSGDLALKFELELVEIVQFDQGPEPLDLGPWCPEHTSAAQCLPNGLVDTGRATRSCTSRNSRTLHYVFPTSTLDLSTYRNLPTIDIKTFPFTRYIMEDFNPTFSSEDDVVSLNFSALDGLELELDGVSSAAQGQHHHTTTRPSPLSSSVITEPSITLDSDTPTAKSTAAPLQSTGYIEYGTEDTDTFDENDVPFSDRYRNRTNKRNLAQSEDKVMKKYEDEIQKMDDKIAQLKRESEMMESMILKMESESGTATAGSAGVILQDTTTAPATQSSSNRDGHDGGGGL